MQNMLLRVRPELAGLPAERTLCPGEVGIMGTVVLRISTLLVVALVPLLGCSKECGARTLPQREQFAVQYGTRLYQYYSECLEPGTYSPDTLEGVIEFVEQRAVLLERCGAKYDECEAATCFEELTLIEDCTLPEHCDLDGGVFVPTCVDGDTAR